MFATVRRMATRSPLNRPELTPEQVPEFVSSSILPAPIKAYIRRQLKAGKGKQVADGEKLLIAAPDSDSTSQADRIEIPNPFLRQPYQLDYDRPYADAKPAYGRAHEFTKRIQKKLVDHYPRYLLPPSIVNPISVPPRIKWKVNENEVAVISWKGEWRPRDEPRGVYSNRRLMFKGHKREREREEKRAETQYRMETMEERIQKWRQEKRSAKVASKASLPF